jgi:hypothetical protein
MPSIPLVSRNAVQAGPLSRPIDAEPFMAPGRAMMAMGRAVQESAAMVGEIALRRQAHVNQGILAKEETVRMETAAGIQGYMEANPDKPETWGKYANDTWKGYEQGRAQRQKSESWAPVVKQVDGSKYANYRAESSIHFSKEQNKALVRQSNARLEANAETKLRAGDYEGFVEQYDKMNLFPDQREAKIRAGLEQGTYKIAANQMDAIQELPPAQQVTALAAYLTDLKDRGEDGRFKNYEYERGGLSLGGRVNLESVANARIREANRAMDANGRRIVGNLRTGRATSADVQAAVATGEISEDVARILAPDIALAQEEVATKKAAKAEALARSQETALEGVKRDVARGAAAGRDIEREVALGKISPEQGRQAIAELEQTARMEQSLEASDYTAVSKRIQSLLSKKLFGGPQPDDAVYRRLQNDIVGAKVTKESRMKLMDELFQLKLADINDLEEEGPDDGRWSDRTISSPERQLRRDVIGVYRNLLPALGDSLAGSLLMNQESKIRTFFDTGTGGQRTQAEIDKFAKEQLLPEIQQAAGFESLREAFKF